MDSVNPRGALWNRWDPHIHAPGTILSEEKMICANRSISLRSAVKELSSFSPAVIDSPRVQYLSQQFGITQCGECPAFPPALRRSRTFSFALAPSGGTPSDTC